MKTINSISKKLLLSAAFVSLMSGTSYAQCVTTGAINADCTLSASSTGAVTIGNVAGSVTVTIDSDITLGHTFDDDDATADGNLVTDGSGLTITQSADIGTTNPLNSLTIGASDAWNASANITTNTINLGAGSVLTQSGATNINANITGSSGVDTITKTGAGNLGGVGNAISLGADDDRINLNAMITVDADTIDGGDGADVIMINGGDVIINSDVTNVETISLISGNQLTVGGSITDATINMSTGGTTLVINAAGENISGTIQARDGFADAQTVTLTDGNVSSDMNLADANDTLNLNGGTYTGNADLGSNDDTLNLGISTSGNLSGGTGTDVANITGAAVTTSGTVSGFETIDLGGNTLTVENTVTGLDTADNTGLDVNSGVLNVNGSGSISGAIHSTGGPGTGTVNFGQDTNGGTFNIGGIIEDVDLTVTSGTVNTNGNDLGANSALGAIAVTAGTFNISDDVTSGGILNNTGTTKINTGATLTVNDSLPAGGTFTFGLDSTAGAGMLVVTGGDADLSGSTVTASVSTGANISNGAEFLIADGTTQVNDGTGQLATTVTDNSFIWNFTMADGSQAEVTTGGADNTEMYLITSMGNTITQAADNTNNENVGNVVLALAGTSNPQLQNVVNSFNAASSQQEVNDLFESLQPTIDGGHVVGAFNVSNQSLDLARVRLASLRSGQTGMSAGDGAYSSQHIWVRGFGQAATQSDRDGIDGYESDTFGFAGGIDHDVSDYLTVGVALSYADTQVDSDNINRTNTEIDSYQATLYGDYDLTERTYINGMLGYTYGSNDTTRHNVGGIAGLDATADFDSSQFSAQMETGTDMNAGNGFIMTPNALINYAHYDADSYTETGAGGANLRVDNDTLNLLEFGIGVDTSMKIVNPNSYTVLEPLVRLGYRYDVIGDSVETTSRFTGGGNTFRTEGFDPAQSTFNIGSSLSYYKEGDWSLVLDYDYEVKEDYDAHSGSLQVKHAL